MIYYCIVHIQGNHALATAVLPTFFIAFSALAFISNNVLSKIEKLYVLNVVELIPSIWSYCTIMSVGLTVLGKILFFKL